MKKHTSLSIILLIICVILTACSASPKSADNSSSYSVDKSGTTSSVGSIKTTDNVGRYSGKEYTEINGNKPNFDESEITTELVKKLLKKHFLENYSKDECEKAISELCITVTQEAKKEVIEYQNNKNTIRTDFDRLSKVPQKQKPYSKDLSKRLSRNFFSKWKFVRQSA